MKNAIKNGLIAVFLITSMGILAQPKRGQGYGNGRGQGYGNGCGQQYRCRQAMKERLNLTSEQEASIKDSRVAHLQEMRAYKNQLMEKRARLQTLQSADNPDMNAINTEIDAVGNTWTAMQKTRAAHLQEVRKILNKEQRVIFDEWHVRRKSHFGPRQGRGRGASMCMGTGTAGVISQSATSNEDIPTESQWEDFNE